MIWLTFTDYMALACHQGEHMKTNTFNRYKIQLAILLATGMLLAGGTQADTSVLDTVTPQVSGCPKYLHKSLVTWSRTGNPQLNVWQMRNVSNKILKVTFTDDGVNSDSATLNPGDSTPVSLVSRQVPPYVVRDFSEIIDFNRAQARKALQCHLAIRPL